MSQIKTIGFVSYENPFTDRRAWSGSIFKLREAIEQSDFTVKWVTITPPRYLQKIISSFLKFRYGTDLHHPLLNRLKANYTDWAKAEECDILFFPGGAQIMKYAPKKFPYIYFADANFHQMIDYYWHNLNPRLISLAEDEERYAIQNASYVIRSSEWSSDEAIKFYNADPEKCSVIEFGANLDDKDIIKTEPYRSGVLNLLFSGVEWERKGGDIAVNATRVLREKYNLDTILTIVGIQSLPEKYRELPYVKNLGFLNKNNPSDYQKYIDTIRQSHLLLLPTKAECSAIVFCEAAAFGLPVFTHDTGGVGNYVINGTNGYRLPLGSTPEDFATQIFKSVSSDEFNKLHDGALQMYALNLNWNSWSNKFNSIIR